MYVTQPSTSLVLYVGSAEVRRLPLLTGRRTLERFRDCGRGREQVELLTEEVTDSDFQGGAADLRDHDRPFRWACSFWIR